MSVGSTSSSSCGSEPNRIADSIEFDFLAYVFDQEPSSLVAELDNGATLYEYDVSHSNSTYEIQFRYSPKSGANFSKTASATRTGSTFGAITVS